MYDSIGDIDYSPIISRFKDNEPSTFVSQFVFELEGFKVVDAKELPKAKCYKNQCSPNPIPSN